MTRIYLGVDAGATKTHALILAADGAVWGFGEGGSGNHEVIGFERARAEIAAAVEAALEAASLEVSSLRRACYCLAGADVSSDFEELPKRVILPITGKVRHLLKNDSFGCLRGGTRDPFGVMVNCGTSQVAVGRNRSGKEIRLGGYGPNFGDFTGGTMIAFQAVAAMVRAEDGRGEATLLKDFILEASGLDSVETFIDRTYRDEEYLLGLGLAPLVFHASMKKDRVARRILLEAAEEIAITAVALIRRLEMESDEFDLVAAGSVFKGEDPIFFETVKIKVLAVAPRARFRTPLYPPVVGAALLALEAEGVTVTDPVYDRMEGSLPEGLRGSSG